MENIFDGNQSGYLCFKFFFPYEIRSPTMVMQLFIYFCLLDKFALPLDNVRAFLLDKFITFG